MRSLAQTTSALDSLAALLPDEAERVEGDEVIALLRCGLRVGDVVVRPGRSPAEGKIVGTAPRAWTSRCGLAHRSAQQR